MLPNKSVVSPVLIGRANDLDVLRRLAGESAGGHGQVGLLAGEAGIGKTRLVSEVLQMAKGLGAQVLTGSCFESDRALPFGPLLDLLRNFAASRQANDLSIYFGSTASELIKIAPELAARLDVAPTPALAPEQEKRRIFQALAQFLLGRSPKKSIIVIEDIHWADDTSLEFLLYLARRIRGEPVLLLLTYRSDEVTTALQHMLAELDRERLSTELVLNRLSSAEVDAMLRAIFDLDRPVRPEFLNVLYPLTEGNPFFLEEILKSLILAGDVFYADGAWDRKPIAELHVPRSIHDAVRRRLDRVGQDARRTLTIGAAVGQRFDFSLIQQLTGLDEERLLTAVKELIAVQLITEETDERFVFRHALTREAIYSQLIERERRSLHQNIGEAMERLSAASLDEQVASLAFHFHQAGVSQKAMDYSARAAHRAQALYAPRAAIEHLTRAMEARTQLALPPSPDFHRERGLAYGILGDFESARSDFEAGWQAAHAASDSAREWQLLLDLGFLWAARDYSEAGTFFRRAYDLAEATNDPQMRAHALNRLGNWAVNVERPLEGLAYHAEALQVFRDQGDQRGLAETLDLLGMANYIRGDLVQSEVYYERAVAAFRQLNDRQALASSLASKMLNSSHLQSGIAVLAGTDRAAALQGGVEARQIAGNIDWRSGEAYALIVLADYFGVRGRYSSAFECANTSLAISQEIEHSQWITYGRYVLGGLYLDVLAVTQALEQFETALAMANKIGSRWWIANVTGYLALAYLLARDLRHPAALLDTALEVSTDSILSERGEVRCVTLGQRMCWFAAAELALARGQPEAALHIIDQLMPSTANASAGNVVPKLSSLRGRILLALKRFDEAAESLEAARLLAEHEGERPALWRIQAALASLYALQGRNDRSSEAVFRAQGLVAEIAAEIPDGAIRASFSKQALAFMPAVRPLSARQAAKKEFGGLTAREREVALMITQGKSNREMADELIVGERTVETHVSNILSKLGLTSRAQVAAWVVDKGLSRVQER